MTEMLKTSETTEKLLKFIDASPSCFHAVKNICVMLEDAGCIRLLENETWALEKGKRYFTTRNGSSVLAFSVPENYNGMQIGLRAQRFPDVPRKERRGDHRRGSLQKTQHRRLRRHDPFHVV